MSKLPHVLIFWPSVVLPPVDENKDLDSRIWLFDCLPYETKSCKRLALIEVVTLIVKLNKRKLCALNPLD